MKSDSVKLQQKWIHFIWRHFRVPPNIPEMARLHSLHFSESCFTNLTRDTVWFRHWIYKMLCCSDHLSERHHEYEQACPINPFLFTSCLLRCQVHAGLRWGSLLLPPKETALPQEVTPLSPTHKFNPKNSWICYWIYYEDWCYSSHVSGPHHEYRRAHGSKALLRSRLFLGMQLLTLPDFVLLMSFTLIFIWSLFIQQ